jgi:hypothetical protein
MHQGYQSISRESTALETDAHDCNLGRVKVRDAVRVLVSRQHPKH